MRIKTVYLWTTGNIMVFDENGDQVAELQKDSLFDLRRVFEATDKETEFYFAEWKGNAMRLDVAWLFDRRAIRDE